MSKIKIHTIKKVTTSRISNSPDREYTQEGTLAELIEYYSYTLETGRSYGHERGNKKINVKPKTIGTLITNLNNAVNNVASDGYSMTTYELI